MVSAKMAAPSAPKMKFFWNIIYEVIYFVHDITNKILSSDARYLVGPKFVNLKHYYERSFRNIHLQF